MSWQGVKKAKAAGFFPAAFFYFLSSYRSCGVTPSCRSSGQYGLISDNIIRRRFFNSLIIKK